MRRLTALAVAVVAAATVGPIRAPAGAADRLEAIREVLSRRAEAVRTGDERTFMATVDRANPTFVRRQRLLFRGFQAVGVGDYRLRLSRRFWPELTTDREVDRYGTDAQPTVLHVEERSVIEGFDRQPALDELYLTFVRRPDGWKVASDSDLDDVSLKSGRKLWEFGPVITRRSEHFLYLSHPDLASAAGPILDEAEAALEEVDDGWPRPWHRRVVLLAPSETEEVQRILQATFDLDVFVAFAYSSVDRSEDWDLVGHRVILNWDNFSSYPEVSQQRVLTHELLHIATREDNGPMVPTFVDEGIADWVAGDTSTYVLDQQVSRGNFDRRLPRDFEFITGSGRSIAGAYQESLSAIRYAVDRFGADAVAELYGILGSARLAPGTPRYHVDRAMRAAFEVGYAQFERGWADWVEATL